MVKTDRDSGGGEASGMDLLRDELVDYLGAEVGHLADKVGDKLADLTDQLFDIAENGGGLSALDIRGCQRNDTRMRQFP
ncbi:hypothetical protein [Streptomyces atratus]|uniref:hypothetical protein n=1 Tax=Streptomyces atratus TaxID=1893 RepID=UPI003F541C97